MPDPESARGGPRRPARDYALFAEPPGATGAGALELVVTRRVIDPRELCLTPSVTERFHAVGNGLCDWVWLSAGLDEPAREPWQVWPPASTPSCTRSGPSPNASRCAWVCPRARSGSISTPRTTRRR